MNITHHSNPGYLMCFIQAEKTWKWLREASQMGGFCRRLVIVYVINDTKTAFVISVYEFIRKDAEILFFFFCNDRNIESVQYILQNIAGNQIQLGTNPVFQSNTLHL